MKPIPLTLTTPEVRAMLAGEMTRFVVPLATCCVCDSLSLSWAKEAIMSWPVTVEPPCDMWENGSVYVKAECADERNQLVGSCHRIWPKFQPGEIVWVREAWYKGDYRNEYRAEWHDDLLEELKGQGERWLSPITMPRRFSRIALRVTNVEVLRLRELTREDIYEIGFHLPPSPRFAPVQNPCQSELHQEFYAAWDARYRDPTLRWGNNPWIASYKFEVAGVGAEAQRVLEEACSA